jgi:hypothetical protein
VTKLIRESKSHHFTALVNNATDQKDLFDLASKLLHKGKCTKLPSSASDSKLADKFSTFFAKKIADIRKKINDQQASLQVPMEYLPKCANSLSTFRPATDLDIEKLIKRSPAKSCHLDPIPTWLVKDCVDVLTPAVTTIVNQSISSNIMPDLFKTAHITPLLKKPHLPSESFKNYRPVSGLPFISKIIEKHVDGQMTDHDDMHHLTETFQSAYTKFSSTESALLRVQNDLLNAIDTRGAALLILLDLSAAFDTIDHQMLLDRLEYGFGLTDGALNWMRSYLTGRTQSVVVNGTVSTPQVLHYGFPQGSVLGPKNFKRYSRPIGKIARKHELSFHLYADDTQLYVTFNPSNPLDQEHAIVKIQNCIGEIKDWMTSNFLKLNDDKTEIVIITNKKDTSAFLTEITVGDASLEASKCAKNLGVIFDSEMKMVQQITATCKRAFCEIRNIGRIRSFLNDKAAASLVHAFVSSKLDYCNGLLYGLPKKQLNKLQRVQNCAARVVSRRKKHDHITPVLASLHWLPIPQRIDYKLLLITFKALNGLAPEYLSELLHWHVSPRTLRSSDKKLLAIPKTNLKTYGDRTFAKAAPTLWNKLPLEMRQISDINEFKIELKTHLYKVAYG